MNLKLILPVAILASALVGCSSAPPRLTGDEPLTVKDFADIDDSYRLKGVKKVAIPNFYLQFVRDEGIETKAREGMYARGSMSYFTQTRVSDEILQKVTDQLYDSFVAELKASGIEVMAVEEMEKHKAFKALRESARKSPFIEESNTGDGSKYLLGVSVLTSARGLPINILNTHDERWLRTGISDGFKRALAVSPEELAEDWKIPLINVRLTMSMITQKGSSSSYSYGGMNTSNYKFKTDIYPRFVEEGTMVSVLTDDDDNKVVLTQPAVIKGLQIAGSDGNGAGARGSGIFGVLGRAIGGSADKPADTYIDVDEANFASTVTVRGRELAHLFIEALTK
jgi:hypothetical protein